jgi:hypothetical protein
MSETDSFLLGNKSGTGPISLEIRNPLNYYLYPQGMASS